MAAKLAARRGWKSVFSWAMIVVLLVGCGQMGFPTVTSPQSVVAQPALTEAPVRSVEALRLAGDPPEVRIVTRVELPDNCYRLEEEEIERSGRMITVRLPVSRQAPAQGQGCAPGPFSSDRVIRLELDPPELGSYVVLVNGHIATFDLPGIQAAPQTPISVTGDEPEAEELKPEDGAPADNTAPPTNTQTNETPETAPVQQEQSAEGANVPAVYQLPPAEPRQESQKLSLSGDPGCNKVGFFGDVTLEKAETFDSGEAFVKTWRVRNEGTCAWGSGYKLVFSGGYRMGAESGQALPAALPGEIVEISLPMTAPDRPGTYFGEWAFAAPDGKTFGTGSAGTLPLVVNIGVRQKPPDPPAVLGCGAVRNREFEKEIFEMINARRAEYGLPPHELVDSLSTIARAHSTDMLCRNKDSHYSTDGMLYTGRLQRAGIRFENSNEIIFAGNGSPKYAVFWWMQKSPLHRSIILSDAYTHIGVGVVTNDKMSTHEWFTVVFIKPEKEEKKDK